MTRHALLAALGALALAAPFATAARGAAPSAWAAAANASCLKAQHEIGDVPRPASDAGMAKATQKVLDIFIRQNRVLAKLPRPPRDAAAIATLLGYYAQQTDAIRGMVAGFKQGDRAAVNAMNEKGNAVNARATALARRLGATSC